MGSFGIHPQFFLKFIKFFGRQHRHLIEDGSKERVKIVVQQPFLALFDGIPAIHLRDVEDLFSGIPAFTVPQRLALHGKQRLGQQANLFPFEQCEIRFFNDGSQCANAVEFDDPPGYLIQRRKMRTTINGEAPHLSCINDY